MDSSDDDYELAKLIKQIANFINEDRYDKLPSLLAQIRRLRRKGASVDFNIATPVLEAFTNAISDYIENYEYDDAMITMEDLGDFLDSTDLPIEEESATRISDAYFRRISQCIDNREYEDAEEWIEDLREFLEDFELTANENLISKVIDSYTSLVEAYIGAKEFHGRMKLRSLWGSLKRRQSLSSGAPIQIGRL